MKQPDPQRRPLLTERMRVVCVVLNIIPIPGLGAIIAGWKNPHSRLLGKGIAQSILVIFGTYPLIVPGVIGFLWACCTARSIHVTPQVTKAKPAGKAGGA